jgi:type VI secretion system protein ImpB|tara:strand:+ start:235 stop:747 length:513 start_codon:yes stop_codon:yes gene_type:complete
MNMALNAQQKRVSKNRVSITYDVETNGAVQTKELPFVIGMVGNYSGERQDKEALEDRTFYQVDKDNFNDVIKKLSPALSYKVDNKLQDDDSEIQVDLTFSSMKDFEPDAIVQKIPVLQELAKTREQLMTLMSKADRSRDLEKILKEILQDQNLVKSLSEELGVNSETGEA